MSGNGLRSAAAQAALKAPAADEPRVRVQAGGLMSSAAQSQVSQEFREREARRERLKVLYAILSGWIAQEHVGVHQRVPACYYAAYEMRDLWAAVRSAA